MSVWSVGLSNKLSVMTSHKNKDETERCVEDRVYGAVNILVFLTVILHIAVCPYTKVEESFNLQAIHDILNHGTDLEAYDHHTFPGVVPRTFLAPCLVSFLSWPLTTISRLTGLSKFCQQYIARGVLGVLVVWAFSVYRAAVRERFGLTVSLFLSLMTLSQFHFLFYSSRPLPNTMALVPVLLSLSYWLRSREELFIFSAAGAILILRGELAMFLGSILLMEVLVGKVTIPRVLVVGLASLLVWVPLTLLVDSYFWRRLVWPEAEVMYFNLVLNKSSDWGTQPLLWYFYSVLPRALGTTVLLLPLAPLLDRRTVILLFPCLSFISLYSLLPHKELRFILYTFPVLNTAAAAGAARLWHNRSKSLLSWLFSLAILGHLAVNIIMSSGLLYISSLNYPGGEAIKQLHVFEAGQPSLSVHLDVLTCQTGLSRFTEEVSTWTYDKTEDLDSDELQRYSHLVMEGHHKYSLDMKPFLETHTFLAEIKSYAGVKLNYTNFPPLEILTKPSIFILKKK